MVGGRGGFFRVLHYLSTGRGHHSYTQAQGYQLSPAYYIATHKYMLKHAITDITFHT